MLTKIPIVPARNSRVFCCKNLMAEHKDILASMFSAGLDQALGQRQEKTPTDRG